VTRSPTIVTADAAVQTAAEHAESSLSSSRRNAAAQTDAVAQSATASSSVPAPPNSAVEALTDALRRMEARTLLREQQLLQAEEALRAASAQAAEEQRREHTLQLRRKDEALALAKAEMVALVEALEVIRGGGGAGRAREAVAGVARS
jgi:hypothetical protein